MNLVEDSEEERLYIASDELRGKQWGREIIHSIRWIGRNIVRKIRMNWEEYSEENCLNIASDELGGI